MTPWLGQAACLGAAVCWAIAVMMFRGPIAEHGARAVNLAKNTIAAILLGATVLAVGQVDALLATSPSALILISLSAILGLTIGDTALFAAVGRLGAHRALLMMTLVPVFAAGLAWLMRDERLDSGQAVGGGIVLAGVALVLSDRPEGAEAQLEAIVAPTSASDLGGIGLAMLGAFGQAAGLVLAQEAMESMPILAASFVRMAVGAIGLVVILALGRRLGGAVQGLMNPAALARVVPPALLGTYFAFLLMMAGIAWAPAAVAAVLLGTSPVFSLFLEAREARRPVAARGLLGTALAVVGIALLASAGR